MTASQRITVYVLLGVVALGLIQFTSESNQPNNPIPTKIQAGLDSLTRTRPAFDSALTTSQRERERSAVAQRASLKREAIARARADSAQRRADCLAVVAAATDSTSSRWRTAFEARTEEATALRVELGEAHQRIDSLAADTVRLGRDLRDTRRRLAFTDTINVQLVATIRNRPKPCDAKCKLMWLAGGIVLDKALIIASR